MQVLVLPGTVDPLKFGGIRIMQIVPFFRGEKSGIGVICTKIFGSFPDKIKDEPE